MRDWLAVFSLALAAVALPAGPAAQRAASGLDLTAVDAAVRPQDDLYRHANGRWLDRTPMPPDRVSYGAFTEIADRADADLHAIILDLSRTRHGAGSPRQQIADLFASHMDDARVEWLGLDPIRADLARIDSIRTHADVATVMGHLAAIGAGAPFGAAVSADAASPGWFLVQLSQGGILLPSRDHYLDEDAAAQETRRAYAAYLEQLFQLVGRSRWADDAKDVRAFESVISTALVPFGATVTPSAPMTLGQLRTALPGFDWQAWAAPQGFDRPVRIVFNQPSFFSAFVAALPKTSIETLKAWLLARFLTAAAPQLPRDFERLRFDFYGKRLTGQDAPRDRWKVGVALVTRHLGDALGRLYVERHFPPRARAAATTIVTSVLKAQRDLIDRADWLPRDARAAALRKLSTITLRVGYPDAWRDYWGLEIRRDDLMGNVLRARRFDSRDRTRRLAGDNRGQWTIAPITINAYYDNALNEIVLPAVFLQPPIFSVDADAAVNFGALGAAVGHELTHALEPRVFHARGAALVDQFNALTPLPGLTVNGRLTLDENVGDLAGLMVAHRAYRQSLNGRPAPVIDGLSGDQRFFLAWAQTWRTQIRDEYLRQWVVAMPHAPPEY
ncbi:MAG TPA: M13 family metallopeptidase, partial [Vicinamibacterales bacterium]|nr:M13 family metallopeptidase [Vicinamibacterales bacterium]